MAVDITQLTHPDYTVMLDEWLKWRYTYESGKQFITKYLRMHSNREDQNDFAFRKDMTYCPAFAKAGVDEIKNSIYQRMADVCRKGGTQSYQEACEGKQNGVDRNGSSMNYFIGCRVLEEMLKMKRVGVYVDMPNNIGSSLADAKNKHPYLYTYCTEDIRAWSLDDSQDPTQFKAVLLRDFIFEYEENFEFPVAYIERFRRIWKQDGVVLVSFYNQKSEPIDSFGQPLPKPIILELPVIPFVMFEISDSLLKNIADYQIALLNLASADMSYALKANFPFYVEQFESRASSPHLRGKDDGTEGEVGGGGVANDHQVNVGISKGRRYARGLDQPAFINPSPEPLQVSMEKQDQLKSEIRELLALTLANLKGPRMASAESKSKDEASLESGLSYIGMTLENGERKIAQIWSYYEGKDDVATIKYPETYTLRTEQDRRDESEQLGKMQSLIPSKTYQKEVGKKLALALLGGSVAQEVIDKINKEVDAAAGLTSDPDVIASDVDHGLLSLETAVVLRGYSKDEAEKAKKDHVERLKRIQDAQTPKVDNAQARGIKDQAGDPQAGKNEKAGQKDVTQNDTAKLPVRGKGK